MPPQHDAFGRPTESSGDPSGRATASAAFAAEPTKPRPRPERPERPHRPDRPRSPHRPVWRLPYLLLVLVVGAGGIGLTLSTATDWAADQPRTHAFALERDPFGPRSLLRADNMRRAVEIARAEARDGELVAGLSVDPERLLLTLTDARDQARWVTVDTAFDVSIHDLQTTAYSTRVPLTAAKVDPAGALRALRRHWRTQQPYAREPSMSMSLDDGDPDRKRARVAGWSLSVRGVATDDTTLRVTTSGRVIR